MVSNAAGEHIRHKHMFTGIKANLLLMKVSLGQVIILSKQTCM